jgi:hypothetical protein
MGPDRSLTIPITAAVSYADKYQHGTQKNITAVNRLTGILLTDFLSSVETVSDVIPIDNGEKIVHEFCSSVPVLKIVGVFPHVDDQ